jgi:hypothetical protein
MVRNRPIHATPVRLACFLPIVALTPGCLQFFPEATLRGDGTLSTDMPRIERALAARFRAEPLREPLSDSEAFTAARASLLERPALDAATFEDRVYAMFRAADEPKAPSAVAAAPGTRAAPYSYDPERERMYVPASAVPADDARRERQFDLARADAMARALLSQRYSLDSLRGKRTGAAAKDESRDRIEGHLGAVTGAAHAGVIDATLSPIAAFDAGAQQIRRYNAALVNRLLDDPDGAPARELARSDVPDAIRHQLEALLETSGMERRRRILRVFAASQLYLEARARLTPGGLERVYETPPESSEQLLHPERYFDWDDPPVAFTKTRRSGLLGFSFVHEATAVAGEFGVYNALEGALPPREARSAAERWGGDLLSVYRDRTTGQLAYAWSVECDHRVATQRLASALRNAVRLRWGGEFVEIEEDLFELQGGTTPCRMLRDGSRLAFVLGGRDELQRIALDQLMLEVLEPGEATSRAKRHDDTFRLVRALASPFFFDRPGRFDSHSYSLYGWAFRHRRSDSVGEFEALNWSELPLAKHWLPIELHGFLFTRERGDLRRDVSFFQQGIRSYSDAVRDRHRFWSPFVSWTKGSDYGSIGFLMGYLFEMGEGAGRDELSPRIAYSYATELDGAKSRIGVVADAASYAKRDGFGSRVELLPYGAGAAFERRVGPDGFSLGFFLDALLLRRVETLPDQPSFDVSLFSFAGGLLGGHFGQPRRHATGFGRIGSRWLFGFGSEDGRWFGDFCWLRIGG